MPSWNTSFTLCNNADLLWMLRGKRWSTDCCVLDWIKITDFLSALCSTVVQQASRCFAGWVRRAAAACKFCRHRSWRTQYKTMISRFSLLAEFVLAGNTVFSFNLITTAINYSGGNRLFTANEMKVLHSDHLLCKKKKLTISKIFWNCTSAVFVTFSFRSHTCFTLP